MADLQDVFKQDPFTIKTILVVEDDLEVSEMLKSILEIFAPYQVMHATNAFQALHIMRNVQPDLFLFDYRLPGIDGLELYQRLHAYKAFAHIPVLFLSAVAPRDLLEKQHLPSMGKPFEMEDLLHKIDKLLPR